MSRPTFVLIAVFLLVNPGPVRAADDDPKALIQKAIKAVGGSEVLARRTAYRMRYRGSSSTGPGADNVMKFTGDQLEQEVGPRKMTFVMDVNGTKLNMVMVFNGDKSWQSMNGTVSNFDGFAQEYNDQYAYQERVLRLLPLLKDKDFTLASLGESKLNDKAVLGVKVSCKGKADTSLFFDKETGLLLKHSIRIKMDGREALNEIVFSDYRASDEGAADEKTLKDAKIATDGPALLKYLGSLIPDSAKLEKARALIKQLGDDSFEVREKASAELVKLGRVVRPLLQAAKKDDDREVARRVEECLQQIDEQTGGNASGAAVRLVALKRPAGAVEALLEFVNAADEAVLVDVKAALVVLAMRDGKPDPALTKALEDKDPLRRKVALAVLGKDGGEYLKQSGRRVYVRGLKFAMKQTHYLEGVKNTEIELLEIDYFNRFDDKVFARP